jgi:hypothetical protein
MFSVGASKLAESALKFGEIASQKVVQVSETVGEKVMYLKLSFLYLLNKVFLLNFY